jgi:hypothetical protein
MREPDVVIFTGRALRLVTAMLTAALTNTGAGVVGNETGGRQIRGHRQGSNILFVFLC